MSNIEIEDPQTGGPITEGFKDLLLLATSTALERRKPNPEALLVARMIASGNFDQLNSDLLLQVFHDAGLYCHRTVIDLPPDF